MTSTADHHEAPHGDIRRGGPFLRMRSRLWLDREFRAVSHAAAGLYLRLHSYLDDQENDGPTGWRFTANEVAILGGFMDHVEPPKRRGDAQPTPLDELVKARLVVAVEGGGYRLADPQGAPYAVREARKATWRKEKTRQRDGQVSGPESGEES